MYTLASGTKSDDGDGDDEKDDDVDDGVKG